MNGKWLSLAAAVGVCLLMGSATVAEVNIETVPVGNPGNADDTHGEGYGRVDYEYRIGTYEVTAGQYCAFLNAVARADTHGVYSTSMWGSYRCGIVRTGSAGNYAYDIAEDQANRPMDSVNFWDACRFANWVHNGQRSGTQDLTTTEDGAYFLNGVTNPVNASIVRQADWKCAIPSEDEWYKAAYHKNDGVTGNYWDYPTGTDSIPSNVLTEPDPGNNANFLHGGYTIGPPYYRTRVGEFENSESPYGTFDQGGNVQEWTERIFSNPSGSYRRLLGGSFGNDKGYERLRVATWDNDPPTTEGGGFRIVYIPEPATLALLGLGGLGLMRRRRQAGGYARTQIATEARS